MTIARHLTLLSFLCTMTRAADSQQPRPTSLAHRSTVYAPHGMIATSQPLATAAGLAVLQRGGNAVDAAVTAAAVLNVVEPPMTGIGGDLFAIVWSAKDHKLYGLNASGRSGSLMTSAALLAKGHTTMPQESVEDITVPGALSGWDALLRRFGEHHAGASAAARHRVRRGRLPRHPDHRRRVGHAGRQAAERRRRAHDVSRRR